MKFAAYMAVLFIILFSIFFWFYFASMHICLYVLYASVSFVNYVFLLLCYIIFISLSILIVMYVPFWVVSLGCSVYCLCVDVYCTTATGCQPNCS
jgi:hypothetical protein